MSLYAGFQMAVAALARSGVNVLLDDLTLDGVDDQHRWNNALHGLDVIWVGVRCAPEIAAEREAGRGSRLPGTARHRQSRCTKECAMTLKSIQAYLIQAKNCASSQNGLNGRGPSPSPHNPINSRRFLPFQRGRQKEPAVLLHGNAERAIRATKSG